MTTANELLRAVALAPGPVDVEALPGNNAVTGAVHRHRPGRVGRVRG